MQRIFGNEHTYRIGGDEFVAFSLDSDMNDVLNQIGVLKQTVEAAAYHISVGCERTEVDPTKRTDMDALIKTAEKRMYQEKERYYAECHYERV